MQVYRAGDPGIGPELQRWNTPATWKNSYQGLADGLFCFGQDLFGRQFALEHRQRIVVFDPETAHRTGNRPLPAGLGDLAARLP